MQDNNGAVTEKVVNDTDNAPTYSWLYKGYFERARMLFTMNLVDDLVQRAKSTITIGSKRVDVMVSR